MRRIWLLFLALLLGSGISHAQQGGYSNKNTGGGVPITTVGGLGSFTANKLALVTDGSTTTDCTVGGGSNLVLCQFNVTWAAVSAAGGGGSLTLQTNGTANSSTSLLNFTSSSANATGLALNFSNPSGGIEKAEVAGTLNLSSLTAPAAQGDQVCGNSTPAWADCVPGLANRTASGTTDTIASGDRLNVITYTSSSAVAVTLPAASSFGNNFAFHVEPQGSGAVTITPASGTINGASSFVPSQGSNCTIYSPDNTNYTAHCSPGIIGWGSLAPTFTAHGVSLPLQGTDTKLLTSGTVSGTGSALCADANGGATTSGCSTGTPVTKAFQTGLTANVAATNIIASATAGFYTVKCEVILTTAATTSSTLPSCSIIATDETGTSHTFGMTNTSSANTVGTMGSPATPPVMNGIYVQAGSAIQYSTATYTSTGTTAMQYSVRVLVEGPF